MRIDTPVTLSAVQHMASRPFCGAGDSREGGGGGCEETQRLRGSTDLHALLVPVGGARVMTTAQGAAEGG